ncbi:acyltransferase [Aquabacterium sp. A08]|uniref:acyltransferase family protein n=1 Tax=Aquabacterium sp. A08 TaxID=2718532 RepID=UPI001423E24E|nr:acyltransferase [Aquabacterium sp. A08]NIC41046.1 acyltransferase [Aquabacterium sp. A08]
MKYYPYFDLLRFVLASVVVLEHAGMVMPAFISGGLAVKVFFVLSGWLIGSILIRGEVSDLPRFFYNRALRIWAPYFVAIFLLYSVAWVKEGVGFHWVKYLLMDVTFTHQLFTFFPAASSEMPMGGSGSQFWSIAVEEQFYLLAPILIFGFRFGKDWRFWLAVTVLLQYFSSHFASIAMGVFFAIIYQKFDLEKIKIRFVFWAIVLVACAALLWGNFIPGGNFVISSLFATSLVLLLSVQGRPWMWAKLLGGISYPLYLNHWIGEFFVNALAKRIDFLGFINHPVFSWVFAVLFVVPLYVLVDQKVLKYRDSLFTKSRGVALAYTAYALVSFGVVSGYVMFKYIQPLFV